jgi:AbrB family looped-hinge helix DNA binding protein
MDSDHLEEIIPKLYGTVTVGERGQIVIPVKARKELGLEPSTKLLVFGSPHGVGGLVITRADFVSEFLARATTRLAQFEDMLQTDVEHP